MKRSALERGEAAPPRELGPDPGRGPRRLWAGSQALRGLAVFLRSPGCEQRRAPQPAGRGEGEPGTARGPRGSRCAARELSYRAD